MSLQLWWLTMLERFFILDHSKGQHFFHPFQMLEFSLGDTLVCLIYCLLILYFIIGID